MTGKQASRASYWERETFLFHRNLIIIGSGIVGLCAALAARKERPDCSILVIDRGTLPQGASTKNAGFACYGSPSELLADIETSGWDAMASLVERRWNGVRILKSLVGEKAMQYDPCGGYEVFDHDQRDLYERCLAFLPRFNEAFSFMGDDVFRPGNGTEEHGLNRFDAIIDCQYEAALNPGRMMEKLLDTCRTEGIQFLNGLQVTGLEEDGNKVVISGNGYEISSDWALLATNAFTGRLLPSIDLYPARNQVLVTSPIANLQLKGVYHHDYGYVYFRPVGDRILIGGARNKFADQEKTDELSTTDNVVGHLIELLKTKIIPGKPFQIDYQWSGILGLGPEKSPILEWQSDRIFAACRLGGMGVAIGAHVGQTAAKAITSR
jgi:gamma-glutamylputrescine oxidase